MDSEIDFVKRAVLKKLLCDKKVGGAHTSIFNAKKAVPPSYRSNKKGKKAIEKAFKELINEQFLLAKQSTNEIHVSINPRKIDEIKKFLGMS